MEINSSWRQKSWLADQTMAHPPGFLSLFLFDSHLPADNELNVESDAGVDKVKVNYIRDHKIQEDLDVGKLNLCIYLIGQRYIKI